MMFSKMRGAIRDYKEEQHLKRELKFANLILDGDLDIVKLPFRVRRKRYFSYYNYSFRRARGMGDFKRFSELRGSLMVDMHQEKDPAQQELLKDLMNSLEASEKYVRENCR